MALTMLAAGFCLGALGPAWAPGAAAAQPGGGFATGVRNASNTPGYAEGEETVSANPANPSDLLVGSNQWQPFSSTNLGNDAAGPSGFTTCAIFASHDGGATWQGRRLGATGLGTQALPPLPPAPVVGQFPSEFSDPGNLISADQNTVWDHKGTAYYQCIYFGLGNHEPQVWVFRSPDAGRTWSAPVVAFDEVNTQIQIDRSFLAVDRSGGPRDGTLYLTFETMFYQAYLPQVFVRTSSDGGQTWGPITRVDDDAHRAMWDPRQYPQVAADGTLLVEYDASPFTTPATNDPHLTPVTLMTASSRDGGRTFQHSVVDDNVQRVSGPDEAFDYFTELIAAFAADPSSPGRMAIAWPNITNGESRIALRYSLDGGRTWSPRIDLADDPRGRGNQHDHPGLAYLPDGRLAAVWRDRRSGGGAFGTPWELFLRIGSFSGTQYSWSASIRLTDTPQPPTTGHHGTMPSEYLGIAADISGVHVAWDQLDPASMLTDNVYRHVPLSELPGVAAATPGPAPSSSTHGTGALPATAFGARGLAWAEVLVALTTLVFGLGLHHRRQTRRHR